MYKFLQQQLQTRLKKNLFVWNRTAVLGVRKYWVRIMSEGYGTKPTTFCCFQSCHATSACKLIIDKVFSCLKKGEKLRETAAIERKESISTTEVKARTFYSVFVQCFWLCILNCGVFLSRRLQLLKKNINSIVIVCNNNYLKCSIGFGWRNTERKNNMTSE